MRLKQTCLQKGSRIFIRKLFTESQQKELKKGLNSCYNSFKLHILVEIFTKIFHFYSGNNIF